MKELHFICTGKMLVATEGPYRFQLWQMAGGTGSWAAAIFERNGRRTAKLTGHFTSKAQAINWLAKYRQPDAVSHSRSGGVSGSGGRGGAMPVRGQGSGAGV